jgi:hypothetical protein
MNFLIEAINFFTPNAVVSLSETKIVEWHDSRPQPTEEEIQAKIAELEAAEPMRQLRQQRDQKLAQSDWMAVADRTMTPEQISYRQSLRDMPANYPDVALNDAGELINVTWPTEPTT